MPYTYNAITKQAATTSYGLTHTLHIGVSASTTSPDGASGAFFWMPKGPVTLNALLSWADLINDPGRIELYSTTTGFVIATIDVAATTTPTEFSTTGFVPEDGYVGVRLICESANTITLHGIYLEFRREVELATTWQDVTTLAGYTFTRASAATDGAPETGLPIDDVAAYATGTLRDVSAKMGVASDYWYLLEGTRINYLNWTNFTHASWVIGGSATLTVGETDPAGGAGAVRLTALSGNNLVSKSVTGAAAIARTTSTWLRQGPGTGDWAIQNTFGGTGEIAKGGTAAVAWTRVTLITDATTGSAWTYQPVNGNNLVANGGPAAGDRDCVEWGPQMENGNFASSFIENNTAGSLTRQADQLAVNLPANWTTGKLVFEYVPEHTEQHVIDGLQVTLLLDDATSTRGIVMNQDGGVARIVVTDGTAVAQVQFSAHAFASGFTIGDTIRLEVDWTHQFVRMFVNDQYEDAGYFVGGTADLSPYIGTQFHIGHDGAGTATAWGLIRVGSTTS